MNVEEHRSKITGEDMSAVERRDHIWREIRARAKKHGVGESDLIRFHSYLSVNLGLEVPAYVDENQRPRNYFPGLKAAPVHPTAKFAWACEIEREFDTISKELLDYSAALALDDHPQNLTDRGRWSVLYFFAGGVQVPQTRAACPTISSIIDCIPGTGKAGNTYLSVLQGGTHIQEHFGPTNARLRCHVSLVVPEGARIRIGQDIYHWETGKCLIFDDGYEHEVWNDSESERIVLIIDLWHPDMTPAECWALDTARRMAIPLQDFSPDSSTMRTFNG